MSLEDNLDYTCPVLAHLELISILGTFFRLGTFSKVAPKKSSREMIRHVFQRFFYHQALCVKNQFQNMVFSQRVYLNLPVILWRRQIHSCWS